MEMKREKGKSFEICRNTKIVYFPLFFAGKMKTKSLKKNILFNFPRSIPQGGLFFCSQPRMKMKDEKG